MGAINHGVHSVANVTHDMPKHVGDLLTPDVYTVC